jgi:chromosome segregation ATPase
MKCKWEICLCALLSSPCVSSLRIDGFPLHKIFGRILASAALMTSLEVRSEDASILYESAGAKVEQTQGLHTAVTKEWGKVGGQLRYAQEKFTVFQKSLENLDEDIAALGRLASDHTKKVDEGFQVLRQELKDLAADAAAKYEQAENAATILSSPRTTAQLFRSAHEQADTLTEAVTVLDALTATRDDIAAFAHKLQNSENAVSKLIESSKSVQDTSQDDLGRLDNSLQTTISPCIGKTTTAKPSGECRKAGREGNKRFQASVRGVTTHLEKESELSSALTRETR